MLAYVQIINCVTIRHFTATMINWAILARTQRPHSSFKRADNGFYLVFQYNDSYVEGNLGRPERPPGETEGRERKLGYPIESCRRNQETSTVWSWKTYQDDEQPQTKTQARARLEEMLSQ